MSQIPTAPPSGFRDFMPESCAARAKAGEKISKVYRAFGFQQIATSAVEDLAVLLGKGGGENEKLIFKIQKRGDQLEKAKAEGGELADMGLRFDLTLPLARYYSKNQGVLPHPFKAFQIGPVWRAERAQKGRYREFYQCDVDVIGSESATAEIDVITAILEAFRVLGLEPTVVVNDRGLLLERLKKAGVAQDRVAAVCVALDKLDKVEPEKVLEELRAAGIENGEEILDPQAGRFELSASPSELRLQEIIDAVNETAGRPAAELAPNLVRGFDYYTGTVFEFRHPKLSGSLGGGGRYDRLTEKFGGKPVPACGGSIGFERLMLILEEGAGIATAGPDLCMMIFSEELRGRSLALAAKLRAAGLSVDVYPGAAKLKSQFKYADSKKAQLALLIGPDEAAAGKVKIKDLLSGQESFEDEGPLLETLRNKWQFQV